MLEITDGTRWVQISEYSEGGYYYEIFDQHPAQIDTVDVDGGLCTGNLADAIIMATSQAGLVDVNEPRQLPDEDEDE